MRISKAHQGVYILVGSLCYIIRRKTTPSINYNLSEVDLFYTCEYSHALYVLHCMLNVRNINYSNA
jgi:hypothetical protein